jgi:hypothetical protein
MGTVNGNGIYFYEETDAVSPLHTLLNVAQQSVSDALDSTARVFRVANTAARTAKATGYGASASNPLYVFRADAPAEHQLEYTIDGTNWFTVPAGGSQPYATASGSGSRVFGGATASGVFGITFPAGRFSQIPNVLVSCTNTGLGIWFAAAGTSTTTASVQGFATGGATGLTAPFIWTATQMTAASANG